MKNEEMKIKRVGNYLRLLKGLSYTSLWSIGLISGFFLYLYPLYLIFIVNPYLHNKILTYLCTVSHLYISFLTYIFNIKLVLSGDRIINSESVVYIMNHRTSTDWNFHFSIIHTLVPYVSRDLRIAVKEQLRQVPLFGWVLQAKGYIFLSRQWKQDEREIKLFLSHLVTNLKTKVHLLIFPEGTDFNRRKKARSDAYAESKGLPKYDYVIHPKTKGFCLITEFLRKEKALDVVYDITIGYPDRVPQEEIDFVTGNLPKEVHMHFERIAVSELPEDEEGLKKWLSNRWQDKEKRLKQFYKTKRFSDEPWDETRILLRYLAATYYFALISVTCTLSIVSPGFRWMIFSQFIFCGLLSWTKHNFIDLEVAYFKFWKTNVEDMLFKT